MQIATLIEILVAVILLGAAVLPQLRFRPRFGDGVPLALVAVPTVATLVPTILVSLSDNVPALHVGNNNVLTLISGLPCVVLIAILGAVGLFRRKRPMLAAVLVALQCGEAGVLAIASGQGWLQPVLACALALVAAFTIGRADGVALMQWGARISMLVLIAGMVVAVIVDPTQFLGECRADKCSLAGQVLVQGLSGNNLGILVAAFSPLVLLGLPPLRFALGVIGLGLFIDLTSARAALLGFAATAVVLGLGLVPRVRRSRVAAFVLLGAVFAVAALPLYRSWPISAFTYRGQLWAAAKQLVGERPVFGWGPAYWTSQPPSPNFPNYGTHSAFLEVLVATGVVGLLLVLGALVLMVVHARGRAFDMLVVLVPICVTGALESTFATQRFTILFGFLPIFLAIVFARQVRAEQDLPHAAERLRPEQIRAASWM